MPYTSDGDWREPNNNDRVGYATGVLKGYMAVTRFEGHTDSIDPSHPFFNPESAEELLSDLLCDLRHYAREASADFDKVLAEAAGKYQEEMDDEDTGE